MLLLLKRDPDVEASLQAKITALHTPGAPEFHRWLTPEQLGAQFGANSQDLETIKGWLHSHGFTIECLSDTAQGGTACAPQNDAILLGGGGTSFSSPAMAGILALIEQRFGRQGDANFVFYSLAARQFRQPGASRCNASQTSGALPAGSCIFNDITLGDIDIPCGQSSDGHFYDCHGASPLLIGELSKSNSENAPAYPATVGYDLATGLGSVNATNLFNAWPRF